MADHVYRSYDESGNGKWHVRSNWCNCHPETCCCDDYAIYTPEGEKHSTQFTLSIAFQIINIMNGDIGETNDH